MKQQQKQRTNKQTSKQNKQKVQTDPSAAGPLASYNIIINNLTGLVVKTKITNYMNKQANKHKQHKIIK